MRAVIKVVAVLLAVLAALPAMAQGRFDTVIEVGDEIVTRYQLDQRTLFLSLLGAPGDARQLAREQLVNETLQMIAARDAGIAPSPEEIAAGVDEFASRANLTGEQFFAALAQNGVQPETFRDFITAGVAWRTFVREELGEEARDFPRDRLRIEYGRTGTEGGVRVRLFEIILPAGDPATAEASRTRAAELAQINDADAFQEAARIFSIAGSAAGGGEVGWRGVEVLPEDLQGVVTRLTEGQTSRPIQREDQIAIYHLAEREIVPGGAPGDPSLDYALYVAASPEEAARVASRIDTCDDLYGVVPRDAQARLTRETARVSALPADLRAAASQMDENEVSLAVSRGGSPALFMLCERGSGAQSTVDYEIIGNRLLNQRLGAAASAYLANLRARTHVRVLP